MAFVLNLFSAGLLGKGSSSGSPVSVFFNLGISADWDGPPPKSSSALPTNPNTSPPPEKRRYLTHTYARTDIQCPHTFSGPPTFFRVPPPVLPRPGQEHPLLHHNLHHNLHIPTSTTQMAGYIMIYICVHLHQQPKWPGNSNNHSPSPTQYIYPSAPLTQHYFYPNLYLNNPPPLGRQPRSKGQQEPTPPPTHPTNEPAPLC